MSIRRYATLAALVTSGALAAPTPFTAAQSAAGQKVYTTSCQGCHGAKLQGGRSPALSGANFLKDWQGKPVQELYTYIKTMMPLTKPGSLTDKQALDVTTFVLQSNGIKPGKKPLTTAALKTTKITAR